MYDPKRWDFKDSNTYQTTHNKDTEFAALKS